MDLDDKELEATRKLNGVDKDKIEEDIYIRCKELTKKENARWIGISNQRAIKKLLERIKELEVLEDDLKDKRVVYIDTPEFAEDYIPVQKVKDKIEEIKKEENLYARINIIQILQDLLEDK